MFFLVLILWRFKFIETHAISRRDLYSSSGLQPIFTDGKNENSRNLPSIDDLFVLTIADEETPEAKGWFTILGESILDFLKTLGIIALCIIGVLILIWI